MRIATLEDTALVEIHRAFLSAFSDYQVPMDMPLDAFTHHLESNSYLPSLSLGAFTQDGLAGFILSGRRKDRLYDCGTGILASHRGCGLGGRLFDSLLPLARDAGIRQCVLEVLQEKRAQELKEHRDLIEKSLYLERMIVIQKMKLGMSF